MILEQRRLGHFQRLTTCGTQRHRAPVVRSPPPQPRVGRWKRCDDTSARRRLLGYNMGVERPVRWYRSARRHRIGKAHALHVMNTVVPDEVPAQADLDARLEWVGVDDSGIELEIVALDLPDAIVIRPVVPTALRRSP